MSTLNCADCGRETKRTGGSQKRCQPCAYARTLERNRAYRKTPAARAQAAAYRRERYVPRRRDDVIRWEDVLTHAADIVRGYDTSVTLRQLFYRLVSDGSISNTRNAYSTLSRQTAAARRWGTFPDLVDRGRRIHEYQTFDDPAAARRWVANIYRRDRTGGQDYSVYIGVEKDGLVTQLQDWFGDLGVPIVATRGYVSESLAKMLQRHVRRQPGVNGRARSSVLLYAGDFDPTGEDILRDLEGRYIFDHIERVALTEEQVEEYGLPEYDGKDTDSRADSFIEKYGRLVQVELDALDPDDLRNLYQGAIDEFWNEDAYNAAKDQETRDYWELLPD